MSKALLVRLIERRQSNDNSLTEVNLNLPLTSIDLRPPCFSKVSLGFRQFLVIPVSFSLSKPLSLAEGQASDPWRESAPCSVCQIRFSWPHNKHGFCLLWVIKSHRYCRKQAAELKQSLGDLNWNVVFSHSIGNCKITFIVKLDALY